MKRRAASWAVLACAAALGACVGGSERKPAEALFVGIDVSGSFQARGRYDDALEFLSYYLYGRLNGKGSLSPVKTLYVGSIGGQLSAETKTFFSIHEFQGRTQQQILADLKAWFPRSDRYTDFNAFFSQVALLAQKRNLALSPITILLLSDGVPDLTGQPEGPPHEARFDQIDADPIEFLSRRVTVRLLYPIPMVAARWEAKVKRQRARMWTVDDQAMMRWKAQVDPAKPIEAQDMLWTWIADNVDYRVRSVRFGLKQARGAQEPFPETATEAPAPPKPAAKPADSPIKKKT